MAAREIYVVVHVFGKLNTMRRISVASQQGHKVVLIVMSGTDNYRKIRGKSSVVAGSVAGQKQLKLKNLPRFLVILERIPQVIS